MGEMARIAMYAMSLLPIPALNMFPRSDGTGRRASVILLRAHCGIVARLCRVFTRLPDPVLVLVPDALIALGVGLQEAPKWPEVGLVFEVPIHDVHVGQAVRPKLTVDIHQSLRLNDGALVE